MAAPNADRWTGYTWFDTAHIWGFVVRFAGLALIISLQFIIAID
jgi:hypothetical protein